LALGQLDGGGALALLADAVGFTDTGKSARLSGSESPVTVL